MGKKGKKNDLLIKIIEVFGKNKKGKVLDLGCGDGDYSVKLKEMGFDVIAGDMDIERFRYKGKIDFRVCNVTKKLPFDDNSFDYILLAEVIEHLQNPYEVMAELKRVLKKGVSNKSGMAKLYLSEKNKGDHRTYDLLDGRKSIEIEIIQLDDYFKDYKGKIDFIKIDIQGAELNAFYGMRNIFKKNQNMKILTEFWPEGLKNSGANPAEYLQFFTEHGFKMYDVCGKTGRMKSIGASELLKTYIYEKQIETNLLCIMQ